MKIPKARFVLKEPKSKEPTLIYLHYRLPGKSKRVVFSTKEYCLPKYWEEKTRRVKNSIAYPAGADINKKLNHFAKTAEAIFCEYQGEIDVDDFKNELEYRTGRKEREKAEQVMTFMGYVKRFIKAEKSKPNSERGTWKKYESTLNHLINFGEEKGKEIDFDDLNWKFKNEFEAWLYSAPREHSTNTVSKTFQVIKKFMKLSYREQYHKNEIFREPDFGVKRIKVKTKIRLTPQEVDKIIKADFSNSEHLDKVRDMFIAACFSGLRISDWKSIRKDHIVNVQGMDFIHLMMIKTKKDVSIPLMPELRAILEKYDYKLPTMTSQPFNRSIKKVLEVAIPDSTFLRIYSKGGRTCSEQVAKWKFASSHAGRRTFASNRYMEGWSLRKIMNIIGHASEKQTEAYMDISDWELSVRDMKIMKMLQAAREKENAPG